MGGGGEEGPSSGPRGGVRAVLMIWWRISGESFCSFCSFIAEGTMGTHSLLGIGAGVLGFSGKSISVEGGGVTLLLCVY